MCASECAPLGARIRAKNNLCVRAGVRLPPRPRHARSVGYVFVSACGCVYTSAPGRFSEWAPPRGRHSYWVPTHRWFSGRMLACHAGGPGSIPGRCMFCIHDPDRRSPTLLANRSTPSSASVAQWLARSAVNRKVGGSTPPGGACSFVSRPGGVPLQGCHAASVQLRCMTRAVAPRGPCGLMDKASDFGSEDCRFESCHGRRTPHNFYLEGSGWDRGGKNIRMAAVGFEPTPPKGLQP